MGKYGGATVKCEVCPDHVTHANSEIVGHKADGRCRCVHRRPTCQKKWRKQKAKLMAKWPELRSAQPAATPLVQEEAAVKVEATNAAQHPDPTPAAPAAPSLTLSLAEPPEKAHHRGGRGRSYRTPAALDERIAEHFRTRPWRRNAASALYMLLEVNAPELLTCDNGQKLPRQTFSSRCSAIVARACSGQPTGAMHPDEVKDVDALRADLVKARDEAAHWKRAHDLQRTASALAEEVVGIVAGLAYRIDVDTLRSVRDLLQK